LIKLDLFGDIVQQDGPQGTVRVHSYHVLIPRCSAALVPTPDIEIDTPQLR
jgi:hypothetical protein